MMLPGKETLYLAREGDFLRRTFPSGQWTQDCSIACWTSNARAAKQGIESGAPG